MRGMTSNPSIFQKAFAGSAYDKEIGSLTRLGKNPQEIYDALTIRDVQDAADLFRAIYDESQGADGFVSLEVSPQLAYDTQGTIEQARQLGTPWTAQTCSSKSQPPAKACPPSPSLFPKASTST